MAVGTRRSYGAVEEPHVMMEVGIGLAGGHGNLAGFRPGWRSDGTGGER